VTLTGAPGVQPWPVTSATPMTALLTVSNWMRGEGGGGGATTGLATGDGGGGGGAATVGT
jgi:hypothetical protein